MTDWISRLKSKKEAAAAAEQLRIDFKLRQARLIDSKLPEWMNRLGEACEDDARELKESFPDEQRYHVRFSRPGADAFQLESLQERLLVQVHVQAHTIDLTHHIRQTPDRPLRSELRASVDEDGAMCMIQSSGKRRFYKPEDLAEWLLRTICGIPE